VRLKESTDGGGHRGLGPGASLTGRRDGCNDRAVGGAAIGLRERAEHPGDTTPDVAHWRKKIADVAGS